MILWHTDKLIHPGSDFTQEPISGDLWSESHSTINPAITWRQVFKTDRPGVPTWFRTLRKLGLHDVHLTLFILPFLFSSVIDRAAIFCT